MLPTEEQIHALIKTGDIFKYSIVGFSAIESAIDELMQHSFQTNHRVELNRMSIELKVDILIAFGSLRKESKGLLIKLSKARNYYAHEFASDAVFCPYQEFTSCFSQHHRDVAGEHFQTINTFADAMRISFIIAYYDVCSAVEKIKKMKQKREEHLLHIEALLAVTDQPMYKMSDSAKQAYDRLTEEIDLKKQEIIETRKSATNKK